MPILTATLIMCIDAGTAPGTVLRKIIAASLLLASILLLAIALRSESSGPANRDFIAYWSAGQLLVRQGNPYSIPDVFALEKRQGFKEATASAMLNPPWALLFVVPLGFVSSYVGALAWILATVACIMMSVRLLQSINRQDDSQDHLLAYSFAPVLACVMGGQMAAFVCLALVLFLYWRNNNPIAAGFVAAFFTIKPHLFLLFLLILGLDCLRTKNFRILCGIALSFAALCAVPFLLDRHIFAQYISHNRVMSTSGAFIPTVSFAIRILLRRDAFWIQFVPLCIGTFWAVWYYVKNRNDWDWNVNGLLLLVLSFFVAPYSTFLDEVILLPVVVAAISCGTQNGTARRGTLPIFFALNGVAFALLFAQVSVMSGAYIWSTTSWLLWYLYASRAQTENQAACAQSSLRT